MRLPQRTRGTHSCFINLPVLLAQRLHQSRLWLPERPLQDRLGDSGANLRSQHPLPAEARSQPEQVPDSTSNASVTG